VNGDVVSLLRPCAMSVYACKSQTESDGDLLFEQRVLDFAELQDSQSTTGF
jgi:hypothetical protein